MSLLYIVGSILFLIGGLFAELGLLAFIPLISLALSVLVLWGNRYFIACFYLPALLLGVINNFTINISFLDCECVYSCSVGFWSYCLRILHSLRPLWRLFVYTRKEGIDCNNWHVHLVYIIQCIVSGMGLATIFFGLICLALSALHAYFVEVFHRDYIYVREHNIARDNLPTTTMSEFSHYM